MDVYHVLQLGGSIEPITAICCAADIHVTRSVQSGVPAGRPS